ncbi:GntR family transcriptional regulator [Thauera sp. 27]|nr:GntR family transcriptional regulator [Thauera sp. 27]
MTRGSTQRTRMNQKPLYQKIASHYQEAIESGALKPGQRLPSLREMTRAHGISLSTAVQACRALEETGWLEARARSGNFVRNTAHAGHHQTHELGLGTERTDQLDELLSIDAILAAARHSKVDVDLSAASCAPHLYPASELRKLAVAVMRGAPDILASSAHPLGNLAFRQAVAHRMLKRGVQVSPQSVIVNHGASEGLALALRAVARPGDAVLLESPTYYGIRQLLETFGVRSVELPTSAQCGLVVEAVEFALRETSRVVAVVNMPTLHNPTGSTMPNEARERLVSLCESHNIALIEDDVYADLHPNVLKLRPQKYWDRNGIVIYCSSFNKTLSPGFRLGWMLGGRWHATIEALSMVQSRPKEELQQRVVARFLESGSYDRHIQHVRENIWRQRQTVAALVKDAFPDGTYVHDTRAGLSMWVKLPASVSSRRLFRRALENRIRVLPGAIFSSSTYFDSYIRLGCGWPLDDERRRAISKVGQLCQDC